MRTPARHRAFTLIELLVVVTVIAILIGVLLPAIAGARRAGQSAICLSNHRQCYIICRMYADDHRGWGPAVGQPWSTIPNWALVIQQDAGRDGATADDLYANASALVCPTIDHHYPQQMTRTCAMNATGHAGIDDDPDSFDDAANPAFIRFDLVEHAAQIPLILDSAIAFIPGDAPPPTRTSSVIDFRNPTHTATRIGRFHDGGQFNAAMFDGSAQTFAEPLPIWESPLP
ncbi:MAG: type II secretion system protein [Phycisphaerales bacterium]|nr:type II secretion system protein [Phycisphaerales bacterium]